MPGSVRRGKAYPRRIGGPIRPGAARALVVGLDLLAVTLAFGVRGQSTQPMVEVSYVFSTDATKLLEPHIKDFNRAGREVAGKRIHITPRALPSGDAERLMRTGKLRPVAWTPASSVWGSLLNSHVSADWAPDVSLSLVQSPQVIAIWEPLVEALGWPARRIGWTEILDLARSAEGWGAYGRPEFGPFKLGHTNPNISTSGLMAAVSEHYAVSGKRGGLSIEDIQDRKVREPVKAIEQAIVHYGDTADRFLERMNRYGKAFAHAVYVQETSLVRFNEGRDAGDRLIGVYPAEGTFVANYPYIVLAADWVSPDQRAAATQLGAWLEDRITPQQAAASGLRLRNRGLPPIDQEHGADPRQPSGQLLEVPSGGVLAAIQAAWNEERKRANVMIAVDTSASMSEEGKLTSVQKALPECLDELVGDDRAGFISFADKVTLKVDLGPYERTGDAIKKEVAELFPQGGTALYDATLQAATSIAGGRGGEPRIDAVVLLTDGKDDASVTSFPSLRRYLESLAERNPVRVFAVVYGSDADSEALGAIVDSSQGQLFDADVTDISEVCREIFSFF